MLYFSANFLFCLFQSYNPISEPFDNWGSKFDISPGQNSNQSTEFGGLARHAESSITEIDFTFPCEGSCEDDDVLTESKIKAFLEEKVRKALQDCASSVLYC
jgi:mitogen-activated protein kinase kinase kinase ANP1